MYLTGLEFATRLDSLSIKEIHFFLLLTMNGHDIFSLSHTGELWVVWVYIPVFI